jgi:glucan 1,3-beta-glucosidase
MKLSATLNIALLASGVVAAPTPGLISCVFGDITIDLNHLLNALGIRFQTNGNQHGATISYYNQCPFTIDPVPVFNKTDSHDLTLPKPSGFVNWKTFKANGANLGGWLEKEQTHDPIWWSSVGGDSAPDEWILSQNLSSK